MPWVFWTRILKNYVIEFVSWQSLVQKQKSLNLGPKMPCLDIFWPKLENNIVIPKMPYLGIFGPEF